MSASRQSAPIESVDFYGLMIAAVRAWVEQHHPDAEYATVIVEIGEGLPAVQVPILQTFEVVS